MHKKIHTRRSLLTDPMEVSLSMLRYAAMMQNARAIFLTTSPQPSAFVWPTSYEDMLRRRTYPLINRRCERASCGCIVAADRLYVDPRNEHQTICGLHGNIVCCAECGRPSGEAITPFTEMLSRKHQSFYCSDLCAANVAA